jgi:hypothetical protein
LLGGPKLLSLFIGALEGLRVGMDDKITARQIRFLLADRKRAWMVQPLHVPDGVPKELQGYYDPPLEAQQNCGWGRLDADTDCRPGRRRIILRAYFARRA